MDNYNGGDVVIATYGFNSVLKEPFEFKYEFGYYTKYGVVVYNQGECSMQDASAFKLDQLRKASDEDLKNYFWGH